MKNLPAINKSLNAWLNIPTSFKGLAMRMEVLEHQVELQRPFQRWPLLKAQGGDASVCWPSTSSSSWWLLPLHVTYNNWLIWVYGEHIFRYLILNKIMRITANYYYYETDSILINSENSKTQELPFQSPWESWTPTAVRCLGSWEREGSEQISGKNISHFYCCFSLGSGRWSHASWFSLRVTVTLVDCWCVISAYRSNICS